MASELKRIKKLNIRNFLGIQELDLTPGKVNIISGPNGAGKTTVLKAIAEALNGGGKKPNLIRVGEETAEVMLDLGEVDVRRRITEKGNYLKVEGLPKGQTEAAFLEGIINPLAFNPVEFFAAKPAERRAMLLQLIECPVTREQIAADFGDELAAKVNYQQHGLDVVGEVEMLLIEQRKAANAVAGERKARAETLAAEVPEGFDADKWRAANVSDLNAQIRAAAQAETELADKRQRLERMESGQQAKSQRIAALQEQITQLCKQQDELREEISSSAEAIVALEAEISNTTLPDASEAEAALAEYTAAQGHLSTFDAAAAAKAAQDEATANAGALDALVKKARALPGKMLADAKLPMEGLEFCEDGEFRLDGVAIEDLSESERMRFALDVTRAQLNGGLQVILVDGVECLDPAHFDLLLQQMQQDEYQYFVTGVTGGEGLSIETMDGSGN